MNMDKAGNAVNFRLAFLSLAVIFILTSSYSFAQEEPRMNLAVAEFEARNVSAMDALTVSDFIRTELVKTGFFKVLDRSNMSVLLEEQSFQMTGCTTQECAVQMGKLLNVKKMVIGNLTKLADVYFITASVIDVETGEIMLSERIKAPTAEELVDAAEELGKVIASELTGRKVTIKESRVVSGEKKDGVPRIKEISEEEEKAKIDIGAFDKVKKRNIYEVYAEDEKIATLIIKNVGSNDSSGKIRYFKKANKKIKPGFPVMYKARKKVGSLGVTIGPVVGGELDTGVGGGFYYDYISFSGWGFQINSGVWQASIEEEYYDINGERSSVSVLYIAPVILKRHYNTYGFISPYIGVGMCTVNYIYEEFVNYLLFMDEATDDYTETGSSLVLNAGVNLFATSKMHLTLDWKMFFGDDFRGYVTSVNAFNFGLSTNW
ncbi:CsgG/HfaB family protein [Elusimicrobiota bacterium]